MDVQKMEQQIRILQQRNEMLRGHKINLTELPLALLLLKFLKGKSFIDKKSCLNEYCSLQFRYSVGNYFSEEKLVLNKSDNETKEKCNKCNNLRNCAIYECKHCEYKFCYYCLIDSSKRQLISNLQANNTEIMEEK